MEPRLLLSAQPVHVGAVYIEEDLGSDLHGDTLLVTFEGGAPGTQLQRVEIDGDQNQSGFNAGDVFFDTVEQLTGSGHELYGADHAFPFTIVENEGIDEVQFWVADGTSKLILQFVGFDAGDRLVLSIDVDEVEDFDPLQTDIGMINDGFDPITSGVEFQGSHLTATVIAPHFATAEESSTFLNRYDPLLEGTNLNLPEDDSGGKRDRTAGAVTTLQQQPIPAAISGSVYHDRNLNGRRDPGEEGLAGVEIQAVPLQTVVDQAVVSAWTDDSGHFEFTSLMPGSYRLVEPIQPEAFWDGLDAAGTVDAKPAGQALNPGDTIDAIFLGGGAVGRDYIFGEYQPVSLAGQVHLATPDGDCFSSNVDHRPLKDALVRLEDASGQFIQEVKTDEAGRYRFENLEPGTYTIFESTPDGYFDGGARAGRVDGTTRGIVVNAGQIAQIELVSGDQGQEYDFCEFEPVRISGIVYHDRNDNGRWEAEEEVLSGTEIRLLGDNAEIVATTHTGAEGAYEFVGPYAGMYTLQQIQPSGWLDGRDSAGTVDGVPVGVAINPGDRIEQIQLHWGDAGIQYNFGELLPVAISGKVCLSTTSGDCDSPNLQHEPLKDVVVELRDAAGHLLQTERTDAAGRYRFEDLAPGRYSVHEITPPGLIDGQAASGSIQGRPAGIVRDPNTVTDITLLSGQQATDVDFCEHAPSALSGHVYHDVNNDGQRATTEPSIGDVTLQLIDADGQLAATTQTNADGEYHFQNLRAGLYTLRQVQPAGWWDGLDAAGTVDGRPRGHAQNPGDEIQQIELGWGQAGKDYDFGELLPARIAGLVHVDLNNDARLQENEWPLAGVRIELLNRNGQVVETTVTDPDGRFHFEGLRPGVYTLRELQPEGYFSGQQRVGTGGGLADIENLISQIVVNSGDDFVDYVFCEEPPVEISGYVFQDGPTIVLQFGESLPEDLSSIRDGQFTPDDRRLPGVVLELRHGIFGTSILGQSALPGTYADGPITVVTDAQGFYRFSGLRKGNYAVYEIQPEGFLDGIDSHGSVPAIAINRHDEDPIKLEMRSQLEKDPNYDAIIRIALPPGQASERNNFSEIAVDQSPPIVIDVPPPTPLPPPLSTKLPPVPLRYGLPLEPLPYALKPFGYVNGAWGKTWHLSVVDGGQPRGEGLPATARGPIWLNSQQTFFVSWQNESMGQLHWTFFVNGVQRAVERFGMTDGIPVAGDFNGDGLAEIGVFFEGQWFIDLNGNGVWDEDDLWAKLGHKLDVPIVGDWDGDGKDDIGIFGLSWPGDPRAVAREPGLPDRQNDQRGVAKNVPPAPPDAPHERRTLQRGEDHPARADLIDHVFYFGEGADRPVSGDWNGDGISTIGVFHYGRWYLDRDGDGRFTEDDDIQADFGRAGDLPIVGDFNGDGIDEIAVYRGSQLIIDSNHNFRIDEADQTRQLPRRSEHLVVGDFDGDGTDDLAFVEASMRFAEIDPRQ